MEQIIKVKDIQDNFQVSYGKACQIIREIKSISDIAGLKGRVLYVDYQNWLNRKNKGEQK